MLLVANIAPSSDATRSPLVASFFCFLQYFHLQSSDHPTCSECTEGANGAVQGAGGVDVGLRYICYQITAVVHELSTYQNQTHQAWHLVRSRTVTLRLGKEPSPSAYPLASLGIPSIKRSRNRSYCFCLRSMAEKHSIRGLDGVDGLNARLNGIEMVPAESSKSRSTSLSCTQGKVPTNL